MTRLLYFTKIQEGRKKGVFLCLGMEERGEGGLYSSGGENMNGRTFNEV